MYYGALKKCDIANGAGVRVTLFVSGCTNHCPDCFQPQTWDFRYGRTCCPSCGRSAAAIPGRISGASPASGWRTSCCRMAPAPAAR